MTDVLIIDCGIGNAGSIFNIIKKVGGHSRIIKSVEEYQGEEKLILPGVGSFNSGVNALTERGFDKFLRLKADEGKMIFGICLGMQLLFEKSEEGPGKGLGLIKGKIVSFKFADRHLKVPHMGWNIVRPLKNSALFNMNQDEQRFYHVHSYHAVCDNDSDIIATTYYGYSFPSAVQHGRVLGVQFHPEKSHRFGMNLIKKIIDL